MAGRDLIESGTPTNLLPSDDLRVKALGAANAVTDVSLDLARLDHLDGGTLQILLALAENQRTKGLHLHLVNASPILRTWFEFAGAASYLPLVSPGQP